ncbi:MAG TPA: serine protease [Planctomycetota bacterium]|nr:serine protease [Planctomycetota bacterium]
MVDDQNLPPPEPAPILRVTPEEVAKAVPPPPRPGFQQPPPPPAPAGPRRSRLAIAGFVLGLLGLGLTSLVGFAALLTSALALAALHANSDLRGKKLAVTGLILGLVSFVGWSYVLWYMLGKASPRAPEGPPRMFQAAGGPPPADIRSSPEPYRTALLANVVVMASVGGGSWSGSGIVVDREGQTLRVLTNRHVAEGPAGVPGLPALWILLSSGETVAASSVWRAPEGIDLCILELHARSASDVPAVTLRATGVNVADEVFAVGNPLEYRWSLTKGVVSSVRSVVLGGEKTKVYQTQTPLSSGNSGGGLYSREGRLVGINTWAVDKSISEGLAFSISIETLIDLLGPSKLPWVSRLLHPVNDP